MSSFTKKKFDSAVNKYVDLQFKHIKTSYEKTRRKESIIENELTIIENKITSQHNSNLRLNRAFFKIQTLLEADKDLHYTKAIKLIASENDLDEKTLYDFTLQLKSLYQLKDTIVKNFKTSENSKSENQEIHDSVLGTTKDYTIARKVLTMSYLLNFIYESEVETFDPDKTKIAAFIQSMVSIQNESKNIANSNYYDKVRNLFGRPDKATQQDLIFVKDKFASIGMKVFVEEINSEIQKKNTKNP